MKAYELLEGLTKGRHDIPDWLEAGKTYYATYDESGVAPELTKGQEYVLAYHGNFLADGTPHKDYPVVVAYHNEDEATVGYPTYGCCRYADAFHSYRYLNETCVSLTPGEQELDI